MSWNLTCRGSPTATRLDRPRKAGGPVRVNIVHAWALPYNTGEYENSESSDLKQVLDGQPDAVSREQQAK